MQYITKGGQMKLKRMDKGTKIRWPWKERVRGGILSTILNTKVIMF